jgi:hypothetical protein
MLPSDHFVKFYNEIFKYLERRGSEELERYYARVAERQAFFTLEAFRRDGLKGMYDYWERIRIEENCDMTLTLSDGCLELKMNVCPSLSKVIDNDAGACRVYCDHCPGWVGRVLADAGRFMVYDLVSRTEPMCDMFIFDERSRAEEKYAEVVRLRGEDLVRTNWRER